MGSRKNRADRRKRDPERLLSSGPCTSLRPQTGHWGLSLSRVALRTTTGHPNGFGDFVALVRIATFGCVLPSVALTRQKSIDSLFPCDALPYNDRGGVGRRLVGFRLAAPGFATSSRSLSLPGSLHSSRPTLRLASHPGLSPSLTRRWLDMDPQKLAEWEGTLERAIWEEGEPGPPPHGS